MSAQKNERLEVDGLPRNDSLTRTISHALASLRNEVNLSGVFVLEPQISKRRAFSESGEVFPDCLKEYDHLPLNGRRPAETVPAVRQLVLMSRPKEWGELSPGEIVSIPVYYPSGIRCGTFHCESLSENRQIQSGDLHAARLLSSFVGLQVESDLAHVDAQARAESLINEVLRDGAFHSVYQPIVQIIDGEVVGHECLTRFEPEPCQPPNEWFEMANLVGRRNELEMAAIHEALKALSVVDGYLSVNISPRTIVECDMDAELSGYPLDRIVLEITEHHAIENYEDIEDSLSALRRKGLSVAIDDAGSGYASLRHILMLRPDMVKIDQTITTGIDQHSGRQALASAFRGFAARIGASLVAEGVETQSERSTLEFIGIPHAQGYLFSRPMTCEELSLFSASSTSCA